ncbi:50S ribosomal protein L11 methyltransferase [Alcanivorax sp. JB21]|uniref:50S ribosomal protein L11 methyltransferase n=1 Tax=Alcanivorax limicola TaxID=2874102 RepID=UPI001CBC1582|nr:50S ribosomal protein L11 methyltransferase [Alcanivorax limicola]MBZ2190038.1 50S ribosomal protein L11 methyltransferase [Alcanivorax limicola]
MPWLQLHIPSTADAAEQVEDALMALGANAVTLSDAADQPLFEPPPGATPLWRETVVSALFPADADEQTLLAGLIAALGAAPADYRFEPLADQVWERAWMDDFKPMQFGERLWIVPSWAEPLTGNAVNLRLDPGLAFGTGTHETTAMCLAWLDGADLTGKTVLDFGCGSGVLAIAALLLGAERVLACDIDPQALLATRENAILNGVSDRLECCLPDAMPTQASFDLVIANILAGPLVSLAPQLLGYCSNGAALVLSGILNAQAEEVMAAYSPDICFSPPARQGDWTRLAGVRADA